MSKRHFWFCLLLLAAVAPVRAQRPPNVVVIFSDDHGSVDLGSYGADDLYTPHLDALAERGVRFTQFYAASSVCAPSRAALLTGRYPVSAGVPGNAESRPELFGTGGGLPADRVTIAEMLRDHGYRTGHFGKWHLGTEALPNDQGFDESFGFLGGVVDKWSHYNYGGRSWGAPPKRHDLWHNGKEVWESGTHTGDLIVREAARFVEADPESPFFLYLAFGNPHFPVQGYDRYLDRYAHLPEPRRSYAAAVSTVDDQVGRFLDRLAALGLAENTVVIFQADQGHSTEEMADYGGGDAGPYRGAKGSFFEGGIRIPAIVAWPGTLPEGAVRDQVAHGTDWLPTIAALTGAPLPDAPLDGESLAGVLRDAAAPSPHDVLHWQLGTGERAQWAVREGAWKLLGHPRDTSRKAEIPEGETLFLVNLEEDVTEMTNLADRHPDVVRRLRALHDAWIERAQAHPSRPSSTH